MFGAGGEIKFYASFDDSGTPEFRTEGTIDNHTVQLEKQVNEMTLTCKATIQDASQK